MPAIVDALLKKLIEKGIPKKEAYAIAVSQMQKAGNLTKSGKVTVQGKKRGAMTEAQREKGRTSREKANNNKKKK